MAFNHYAKLKRILTQQEPGWYIRRINESTSAKTFQGELKTYDHYYRIYDHTDKPIKYGKFQQLDRLATALQVPAHELPILD